MATYDMITIGDYLSVVVKGSLNVPVFRSLTDEMLDACQAQGIRKVLVDVSACVGTFTDADKIEFAKYASDKLVGIVDRYAYVYPHEHLNYSSAHVAQGRGLNVRAYYNIENAIEWMEKK